MWHHNTSWLWLVVAGSLFLAGCRTSPQTLAAATPATTPTVPATRTPLPTPPPTPTWSPAAPPMPSPPAPPPPNYPTAVQNIPRPVIETPTPAPTVALPTPMPNPCLTPVPAGAAWTTHTTRDGSLTFQYPANWALMSEYPLPGTPVATEKVIGVSILNVPVQCGGNVGKEAPDHPEFLFMKIDIYPHALQGYADLESYVARHTRRDFELETQKWMTIAGQPGIKRIIRGPERVTAIESVFFANRDTIYIILITNPLSQFAPIIDRLLNSIVLNP